MEVQVKEVAVPARTVQDSSPDMSSRMKTSKTTMTDDDIRSAVFRVIKHSGWRSAKPDDRPGWQSPRRENPDRNEFCPNYHKFGHKPDNCWKDIVCDRCRRLGHPAFACKVQPCNYCGKFHDEKCQAYQTFQAIKDLVRKGMLKDLPQSVQKSLLDDEDSPGTPSNE
jgi:ribosomal protein L37E